VAVVITCKTCGTLADKLDSDHGRPIGWYRITIGGDAGPGESRINPGSYCCAECLCVAVLGHFGLDEQTIREWLRPRQGPVGW
jgi:hypothetical protein